MATEKGYFALHGDSLSHLVYDLVFDLHSTTRPVRSSKAFLKSYPDLLAFGDGEITTGGYAPGFVEDWMKSRLAKAEVVERNGRLVLSDEHRRSVADRLARFE